MGVWAHDTWKIMRDLFSIKVKKKYMWAPSHVDDSLIQIINPFRFSKIPINLFSLSLSLRVQIKLIIHGDFVSNKDSGRRRRYVGLREDAPM